MGWADEAEEELDDSMLPSYALEEKKNRKSSKEEEKEEEDEEGRTITVGVNHRRKCAAPR